MMISSKACTARQMCKLQSTDFPRLRCFRREFSAVSGKPRRVVVTGVGLVTPLATGTQQTWQRLIAGQTAVAAITDPAIVQLDLPAKVAASVKRSSAKSGGGLAAAEFDAEEWVPRDLSTTASPFIQFAMSAATQALDDAKWRPSTDEERNRCGVAIGSGIGSVEDAAKAGSALYNEGQKKVSPYVIPRLLVNLAAGHVSIQHKLRGPNHAVATACTTGAHAIGDSFRFIKYSDADVMLAGGTEASVSPMGISLFSRIRALGTRFNSEPALASRPFDQKRDGFVMGEGAAVLVLEELSHAQRRNARIYAEIAGYGLSGDANHITAPAPDGRGAILCMQNALRDAGLQPHELDYVNAHATSTPLGDAIEARAIKHVFGEHATSGKLLVSSTKGAVGHMLGAAGAAEAAFCALAVHAGVAPPTLNLTELDPACAGMNLVPLRAVHREIRAALTNSFGFGGTNAALVLKQFRPES